MRKALAFILALILCGAALAEAAAGADVFVGKWEDVVSERAWMRVDDNPDGNYDVRVFWGSGIYEGDEWYMTGVYDPETGELVYENGGNYTYTYDDAGQITDVQTNYENARGIISVDSLGVLRFYTEDESLSGCRFVRDAAWQPDA